jgi:endonuclease YncB( thermonuclease family)
MIEWLRILLLTTTLVTVTDGDTVKIGDGSSVRLVGFNTPEIFSPKCDAEHKLGLKARDRLNKLVKDNRTTVTLTIVPGNCAFGRKCGRLTVHGQDVGEILISEGLAEKLDCPGGRCPKARNWCQ